jgi:hypothetical protein
MDNDQKFNPTGPLLTLSAALGDAAPNWYAGEELNQLRCLISIGCEIAVNLQLEHLLPLVQLYGEALFCRFLVGERIVLDVNQNINQDAVTAFHGAIGGAQQIDLDIRIDKYRLAADWFNNLFSACQFSNRSFLYMFPERFGSFIGKFNLTHLEERLWNGHVSERVVLFIPNQEICILGPYILVIGGEFLKHPPASILNNQMKGEEELARVYGECQETLKWQKPWIGNLTPWHLYTESLNSEITTIGNSLRVHFCNLFLLYTADRTTEKNNQSGEKTLFSSYTTSQQAVDVGYNKASPWDIGSIPNDNFNALLHIFEWSYHAQWKANDRLPLVQIGIVEALKGTANPSRFKLLLENSTTIFENITWHWKAFIEGKIDAYADQIQNLEEQVGKTVTAYSEQITAIIASLTETLLAAIAVVLASFIASLFQDRFNPIVFQIGVITYAIYVFFFPLIYNMRHRYESIDILDKEFKTQKGWFEKRLPPDRVKSIIDESQTSQNKGRFNRWFWWTVVIYILLSALLVLAAFTVPGWILTPTGQMIVATATATPTSTPTYTPSLTALPTVQITMTPTP